MLVIIVVMVWELCFVMICCNDVDTDLGDDFCNGVGNNVGNDFGNNRVMNLIMILGDKFGNGL